MSRLRSGNAVQRLVLIGASPGIADPVLRARRRASDELLAQEIESLTIDEFAVRWARTPVLAGLSPKIAAIVHADRLRNDRQDWRGRCADSAPVHAVALGPSRGDGESGHARHRRA